tara:strand:- start:1810 stop:2589 length:780 start_codon:yes stop_codon:yes gene_type:complete
MSDTEKFNCLYINRNIKHWYPAGNGVVRCMLEPRSGGNLEVFVTTTQAEDMTQWLGGAVRTNDVAAARAFLEAGIPHNYLNLYTWLIDAVKSDCPEMAALLCKYGATANGKGWLVNRIMSRCTQSDPETRKLWEFALKPPTDELGEKAQYIWDSEIQGLKCATSWPPFELRDEMPLPVGSIVIPLAAHRAIRELWDAQCLLRRAEARCLAKFNWMRARERWRARTIALYWLGAALERRYAPGGQGRAEDLLEYRAEFAS